MYVTNINIILNIEKVSEKILFDEHGDVGGNDISHKICTKTFFFILIINCKYL